jgi:hypothetical protein
MVRDGDARPFTAPAPSHSACRSQICIQFEPGCVNRRDDPERLMMMSCGNGAESPRVDGVECRMGECREIGVKGVESV